MGCSITQFLIILFTISMAFSSSLGKNLPHYSTISAAPALLPYPPNNIAPLSAPPPILSPDISPLFPSPGGPELSPSVPIIIPSTPSPPNPDAFAAPGPGMAPFAPSGILPDSSSVRLYVPRFFGSMAVLYLVAFG